MNKNSKLRILWFVICWIAVSLIGFLTNFFSKFPINFIIVIPFVITICAIYIKVLSKLDQSSIPNKKISVKCDFCGDIIKEGKEHVCYVSKDFFIKQNIVKSEKIFCKTMETEVTITNGDCSLKMGSILGLSPCPNKQSLICPIEQTAPISDVQVNKKDE